MFILTLALVASPTCLAIDGDTLRCGRERIRLVGIDAPEMGNCPRHRRCAPGDPVESKASLAAALVGVIKIERVGYDRYGRTLATVRSARGDLSCWQLTRGRATYRVDWDNDGRVAARCSAVARRS